MLDPACVWLCVWLTHLRMNANFEIVDLACMSLNEWWPSFRVYSSLSQHMLMCTLHIHQAQKYIIFLCNLRTERHFPPLKQPTTKLTLTVHVMKKKKRSMKVNWFNKVMWNHFTLEKSLIFFVNWLWPYALFDCPRTPTFTFSHLNCVAALFPRTKIAQILTCILGFGWCYYSKARCYSVCSMYFALKAKNICFSSESTELVSLRCVQLCFPLDKHHRNKSLRM